MLKEFIFTSGLWLGEGEISFTAASDRIKFYTKWEIKEGVEEDISAKQIVEMHESSEPLINHYTFRDFQETSFSVVLENPLIGVVKGIGKKNDRKIFWEFRNQLDFEGFESYEKQENGEYFFRGEYGGEKEFRTVIQGTIWKKTLS